jgi:hypothetical protein
VGTYRAGNAQFLDRLKKMLKLTNLCNVILECLQEAHVARIRETRNSHKFGCKSSQNRYLPTLGHTWEDDTKMLLKEQGYKDVNWPKTRSNGGTIFGFHYEISI